MSSIREKINTLRERAQNISRAAKLKFIAIGVSFTLLATSLTGCAVAPNNQTELEDKIAELEAYIEMLEEESRQATIDKYVTEIEVYKQIVGELKIENDNLKSHNHDEISEKLDKIITLLEAIEKGSLKGEDLEGAIEAIKEAIKEQTEELKQNMINPDGVPSTDKEQPNETPSTDEKQPEMDISVSHPLFGVEQFNGTSTQIAFKIRLNINLVWSDVLNGEQTNYPELFQFCEETQSYLENAEKSGAMDPVDVKITLRMLHEYQLLLVEKNSAPAFEQMDDSGYMKINFSNVDHYNPNNPYIENLEYGINTSTGSCYCVNHDKTLDEFCGYFDSENKTVNSLYDGTHTAEQDTEDILTPAYKNVATDVYKHVFTEIKELDAEFDNFEIVDISEKDGVFTIECTGGTKTIESTDEYGSPETSTTKAFPATYVINTEAMSVVKTQHLGDNQTNTTSHVVRKLTQEEFNKMVEAIQEAMEKAKANQQNPQPE